MRVLAPVPFERVLTTFVRDNPYVPDEAYNTNDDAEENLCHAQLSLGRWYHVLLDHSDVLEIVLPWHMGEYGAIELIPPEGASVGVVAARIRELGAEYAAGNPVCAAKLDHHAEGPMGPLYLSTRAIPGADYERLVVREGLVHLDGLHRVLAWVGAGRLDGDTLVEAYVAMDAVMDVPGESAGDATAAAEDGRAAGPVEPSLVRAGTGTSTGTGAAGAERRGRLTPEGSTRG
ncbi:DUF6309 family protein [Streptomyces sp. NPDC058953]|uniref:DUF6309 family protein n=1 Tax=unclassified Streptomyces TaxID=2593676 RepID=UPI0036C15210